MADPVEVIAHVLSDDPDDSAWAQVAARQAVAALKANPDALAALLEPVGWYGETNGGHMWVAADTLEVPPDDVYLKPIYRLPESPHG